MYVDIGGLSDTLPCQLPPKELNPGSFSLPCTIGSLKLYAMADLRACANIMPNSIFKHLGLTNLKETNMLVEIDDMTQQLPLGIVENVLVKIDKFMFPCNFVIIDMSGALRQMMILGKSFLATIHAQINRRYYEWSAQNYKFDNDRTPSKTTVSDKYNTYYPTPPTLQNPPANECIPKAPNLGESSRLQPIKPRPCDYSFDEWLKVKIRHSNIHNSYREIVFNEWILDSFDVEEGYAKEIGNPYSRRFDEYKRVFSGKVEQLSNEYMLRIGKKGYVQDDVCEKCEQYHGETLDHWHDKGFEEEEL
ncbi:BYPASS-related protein [Tanacetum coccineum]